MSESPFQIASWESLEFSQIVLDRIKEARANNAATKGREVRSQGQVDAHRNNSRIHPMEDP